MTAIVAVWNRSGVAIAADRTTTVMTTDADGREVPTWADEASKVFLIPGHHVAIATSDSATLRGIPILQIVRRWAETIAAPFPSVNDYLAHFLEWLGRNHIPLAWSSTRVLESRIGSILNSFVEIEEEGERSFSRDRAIDLLNLWKGREPENVFGDVFPKWIDQSLLDEDEASPRHYFLTVRKEMRKQVSSNILSEELKRLTHLVSSTFDSWVEDETLSPEEVSSMRNFCLEQLPEYLVNYLDAEDNGTNLLFIGYGTQEWVPAFAQLRAFEYSGRMPRAYLSGASTADFRWWVGLGYDQQILTVLDGISHEMMHEVRALLPEESSQEGQEHLDSIVKARRANMYRKIDNLSLEKLKFVARSFVEIEGLASFLVENVPGVGGEVEVFEITR